MMMNILIKLKWESLHKMADRLELFKRLCVGAEFDREQFSHDMEMIRVCYLIIMFYLYACASCVYTCECTKRTP